MSRVGRRDDYVRPVQGCRLGSQNHVAVEREIGRRRLVLLARLGLKRGGLTHRRGFDRREFDLSDEGVEPRDASSAARPDKLAPHLIADAVEKGYELSEDGLVRHWIRFACLRRRGLFLECRPHRDRDSLKCRM